MPSQVWGRSPQEASDNPYEYEIQDQFVREAEALLKRLNIGLQIYSMKFHRDDHSVRKAVWMLQLDALIHFGMLLTHWSERIIGLQQNFSEM